MVTEAVLTQVIHRKPKLAPLSWQEHLQHGHVPFRRDCLVCQQSLQQQPPHRKGKHPLGGQNSIDTTGPFIRAHDVGGYKAAYILLGALTWTVPKDSMLKKEEKKLENLKKEHQTSMQRKKKKLRYQLKIKNLNLQSKASWTTTKKKKP